MEFSQDELRKYAIFHPFAFQKYMKMQELNAKFVHYCSAEAAFHIIRSGRVRRRNAAVMNEKLQSALNKNPAGSLQRGISFQALA